MSSFRKAFIATIVRSLLRGKSLLQAIIGFWLSPLSTMRSDGKTVEGEPSSSVSLQQFLRDAEADFLDPLGGDGLSELSAKFKKQYLDKLAHDVPCMLPSYSHQLPRGIENGRFLALDVGGSTLRVAIIELRKNDDDSTLNTSEIISIQSFPIGRDIKDLVGMAFFEWMGARIAETLATTSDSESSAEKPLPMALAWSFPIEQTSLGGGKLQPMGKGFLANVGLVGQELGDIIRRACKSQDLHVELRAILNDSSACLLSRAYSHTSTRFGLILGTGVNCAVYLPVSSIGRSKFGQRPAGWFDKASHVIVNTELSMFGGGILPLTRWDEQLLKDHPRPDFQPLEHLVSGMYLGEIVRLVLIEAISTTGLLGGVVPPSLNSSYTLGTDLISMIEGDTSEGLTKAIELFSARHHSSHVPTTSDLEAIKSIGSFVSKRSSALVATAVYSLWDLRLEGERDLLASLPEDSPRRQAAEEDLKLETTTVAFNGSVIENYPGYLSNCQRYVDELVANKGLPEPRRIELVSAKESSLTGAAVALACTHEEA
ncbi:Hexokinase-1 [Escovopsis weberi]|uniref:Phosphotransferase n=1 Tax=Escovopsis weberi TaxID=150374 RepID=A0A0M8MZ93_ESCWE|nr:Hexokinase-1 [Escovopsis weberi]